MSVSIERFGGGCKLLAEWCRASTEPGAHGILYINITLVEKQKKGNDWQLEWTKAMPHLKVRKLKKHVLFVSKSKSKSRGIFQIMWVNLCALPYNSASISSSALLHCFITNNCHKKKNGHVNGRCLLHCMTGCSWQKQTLYRTGTLHSIYVRTYANEHPLKPSALYAAYRA